MFLSNYIRYREHKKKISVIHPTNQWYPENSKNFSQIVASDTSILYFIIGYLANGSIFHLLPLAYKAKSMVSKKFFQAEYWIFLITKC